MTPLPIDEHLPEILDILRRHRSLVLVAPPGAGKTTRVPPAIVGSELLSKEHHGLIVLEPRRVAARATAARIAHEQGWTLGQEVGYQVRHERLLTQRTLLRIQTEGILNRQLLTDPFLESIGAVVLDEFHERSIHSDLALGLLREVRRDVRPDLLIVVMSATLDAEPVAQFLDDCPVMRVHGHSFPVEVLYRPALRPSSPEAIEPVLREALASGDRSGHSLIFLPGMAEIRRVQKAIEPVALAHDALVLPLHGSLPAAAQDRALAPGPSRKIILATNIAETSLTIDGVTSVIDSGLARVAHHDAERGFDRLDLRRISQASATQRAGRAGRTGPGTCFRLWSERQQQGLPERETPEVHRVDLCPAVLALHVWGIRDAASFGWFDRPATERLEAAQRLLTSLEALDPESGRITTLGRLMLDLPLHPRLARVLIAAARESRVAEGATLAALLSERDIALRGEGSAGSAGRPQVSTRGRSDLLPRLDWLAEAEAARFSPDLRSRGIDPVAAAGVARVRNELIGLVKQSGIKPEGDTPVVVHDQDDDESLLKWLILAYPDRVVKRRGSEETGVMIGGRGVRLSRDSVVRESELFLALDPRQERREGTLELQVSLASSVRLSWLEELLPTLLRQEEAIEYHETRQRVIGSKRLYYQDLLIREDIGPPADPVAASLVLAAALRPRAKALFLEDPAASTWLARYAFIKEAVPELDWPELDQDALAELMTLLCQGRTRLDEVRQADKIPYLESRLSPAQSLELCQSAPLELQVPSGRRVRLVYEPDRPPTLAIRLQELFGWTETPRLARGRSALVLHLLGPNYRPVQITSDLKSFWTTTYHQVRKDLRRRYPKHAWPEDPLSASPARGR
ncbi:MAG: ATP-dependent helicase HrpB [Planctomycetaceae bacterium]|nr:ATP-dependent helicase HrpB [Planctomycetaceae bacterium]